MALTPYIYEQLQPPPPFPYCRVCVSLSQRAFGIFSGKYWLRYAYVYATLLIFGLLVVTT